jgi:hypothetical protein
MPSIDGTYLFCPLPDSTTVCISRVNAKYRMIFLMIQAKPLELQANALPTTMTTNKFASVWDAIENTPEEAENMKLRSSLMIAQIASQQDRINASAGRQTLQGHSSACGRLDARKNQSLWPGLIG